MDIKVDRWTTEEVCSWLRELEFDEASITSFMDNEIDGETLRGLTESMVAELLPKIKLRVKFLKAVKSLTTNEEMTISSTNLMPFHNSMMCSPTSVNCSANVVVPTPCNHSESFLNSSLPTRKPSRNRKHVRRTEGNKDVQEVLTARSVPAVYELPSFPEQVQTQLDKKNSLSFRPGSKCRSNLIEAIYCDLRQCNILYPSTQVYSEVCSALTSKYPFLADFDGSSYSLRMALRAKFKRCRQPLASSAAVASVRAKFGRPGLSGRKRKMMPEVGDEILEKKCFKQTDPVTDKIDDEENVEQLVKEMQQDVARCQPDMQTLKKKMKITSGFRRKFCQEHSTESVLAEFPCLRLASFFIADAEDMHSVEFSRIGPQLLQMHSGILVEAQRYCQKYSHHKENIEDMICDENKMELAMKLLPSLFGEDEYSIFPESSEELPLFPALHKKERKWLLSVDRQVVFSSPIDLFSTAVQAWYACFWTLSIQYTSSIVKTCTFIEKVILGRSGKLPLYAIKWANRLLK